jgi:hypothetical protein
MPSEIKPGLDARTPLLLLPVRIETRFVDSADSSQLLVRIYLIDFRRRSRPGTDQRRG